MRLLLSSCLALACAVPAQISYYSASMSGAQEVPPVATAGGGYGIVRVEEPANIVRVFVSYFGTTGAATAAHLHQAPAGSNGGVIIPLTVGATPDVFSGTATLTPAQVNAVKTAGTYINVHTAAFPGGEVRGQVVASTSTRFQAMLDGSQEVPPNASTNSGRADAYLHEPDNRLVYCVETSGLAAISGAHLHGAPSGSNGGVIFPLNGSAGFYCGVSPQLSAAQVAALLADNTYFNIHTAAFPGGEIRGQLLKDQGTNWVANLDGAQAGTASTGLGSASLQIGKNGDASIVVSFGGLTGSAQACHIHFGAIGVSGPVVVPLSAVGGKFVATFTPTTTNLAQVRAGDWYVNLHTTAFPGGEIRGQLMPAALPTTYGPNCPGSSGVRPEIGATGFACVGAAVDVELYGALPGAATFLALGFNRDTGTLGGLPLRLTSVGVNAPCFVLLSSIGNFLTFADANGCATRGLNIGFVPGLRGINLYGQWIVLDAAANPAGLVTSNALSMLVQ